MDGLLQLMSVALNEPKLKIDDTMEELAGWDSLSHMELIFSLEGHYQVEFTGDEIAELRSVSAIVKALEARGKL